MAQEVWDKAALDDILSCGDMLSAYCSAVSPDDSFGWGKLFRKMWFSDRNAQPSGTGVLLTGPAGCGKHTAASHLIRELGLRGYRLAVLPEDDLQGEGPNTPTRSRLNSLLDRCFEEGSALCLLAEELSSRSHSRELAQYLGEMLCLYFLRRGENSQVRGPKDLFLNRNHRFEDDPFPPFFLILIESRETRVPGILRSRLQLCRMSPPDRNQRSRFLYSHPVSCLGEEGPIAPEQLLDRTEGMSYAQLEDLVNAVNALTETEKKIDEEAVLALVDSQLPPSRGGSLSARMDRFLEELPKALAGLKLYSGGDGSDGQLSEEQKKTEDETVKETGQYAKDFEKDSVFTSAADIVGDDFMKGFVQKKHWQVDLS